MTSQRQDALTDQMRTVHRLAVAAGCYDAADWIERRFWPGQAQQRQLVKAITQAAQEHAERQA